MPGERAPGHRVVPEGWLDLLEIGSLKRVGLFCACCVAAFALFLWARAASDLDPAAARALLILILAALLWVSEAVPPFAVGVLVIGLQIALLGNPEGPFAATDRDWEQFVAVVGHPLVWLFFGGFVLAAGMARTGLDQSLARRLLERLGDRPASILLGVMAITFVLSMFVSNTATTAMMLALLAPLLAALPEDEPFATALLLGLAAAANLGGMASLIGTPPNAIAVGALADAGSAQLSFLDWLVIGFPPALVLLLGSALFLTRMYPARQTRIDATLGDGTGTHPAPRWQRIVVASTVLTTVGLWLTSGWHGLPTAVVSFVPTVVLTLTGVLGAAQIRSLHWDVLLLLAGGLALGQMVTATGLSTWIVAHLPIEGLGVTALALVMAYACVALSNVMSNTAAANVLVPVGATMAVGFEAEIAVPIALAASAAMCLPVATPPNAMVFSTGRCRAPDFLRLGLLLGAVAPLLAVLWSRFVLPGLV